MQARMIWGIVENCRCCSLILRARLQIAVFGCGRGNDEEKEKLTQCSSGGPRVQDTWDKQAASASSLFLYLGLP